MSNRSKRLAGDIKRELTDIVHNNIKDPRVDTLVSLTDVDVSSDLSHAKVYVSKIGSDSERQELVDVLNKAAGFIRTQLSKRLKTRTVPELHFHLDDSLQYGEKIETLLSSLDTSHEE